MLEPALEFFNDTRLRRHVQEEQGYALVKDLLAIWVMDFVVGNIVDAGRD